MTLLSTPLPVRAFTARLPDLLGRLRAALGRTLAQWRHRRDAIETLHSLGQLDDRTLRDLGLHRSEIGSVSAELGGFASADRRHAVGL